MKSLKKVNRAGRMLRFVKAKSEWHTIIRISFLILYDQYKRIRFWEPTIFFQLYQSIFHSLPIKLLICYRLKRHLSEASSAPPDVCLTDCRTV
jgi:hypothetical protein